MPLRASERSLRSARRDWERSVRVIVRVAEMRIRGVGRKGCCGDDERKCLKRVGLNSSRGPAASRQGDDDTRGSRDSYLASYSGSFHCATSCEMGIPSRRGSLTYSTVILYSIVRLRGCAGYFHASKRCKYKLRGNVGKGDVNQLLEWNVRDSIT
jgi:hypothetical protein